MIKNIILTIALIVSCCTITRAGGGPDNMFLVVNNNSSDSKTVANYYINWRNIPSSHVLYLDWEHDTQWGFGHCQSTEFRPFLQTIIDTITSRKLEEQIDYICYSSDFPFQINLKGETFSGPGYDLEYTKGSGSSSTELCSITGLTYLYQLYLAKSYLINANRMNGYTSGFGDETNAEVKSLPSRLALKWSNEEVKLLDGNLIKTRYDVFPRGFRHNYTWRKPKGQTNTYYPETQKYYLSTMLASMNGGPLNDLRGNTLSQIVGEQGYLKRSIEADGKYTNQTSLALKGQAVPVGTFYFMFIDNSAGGALRSKYRHGYFTGDGDDYTSEKDYVVRTDAITQDGRPIAVEKSEAIANEYPYVELKYAVERLNDLGVNAEEIIIWEKNKAYSDGERRVPANRTDILGIITGTGEGINGNRPHLVQISENGSALLAGAIVDNITSYGGSLHKNAPMARNPHNDNGGSAAQTPITYWLSQGAAGATGTIAEPWNIFAMPDKFPAPNWPENYVNGNSIAEAIYQSLETPFQTLVMGDALCQPWTKPPIIEVDGLTNTYPYQEISGLAFITPKVASSSLERVRFFELHVDGQMVTRYTPQSDRPSSQNIRLSLNTLQYNDGYHQIVIVGVADNTNESQARLTFGVNVNNKGYNIETYVNNNNPATDQSVEKNNISTVVDTPGSIELKAKSTGTTEVSGTAIFYKNNKEIARIGPIDNLFEGSVGVETANLGKGPVPIYCKVANDDGKIIATAPPLWIQVGTPIQ